LLKFLFAHKTWNSILPGGIRRRGNEINRHKLWPAECIILHHYLCLFSDSYASSGGANPPSVIFLTGSRELLAVQGQWSVEPLNSPDLESLREFGAVRLAYLHPQVQVKLRSNSYVKIDGRGHTVRVRMLREIVCLLVYLSKTNYSFFSFWHKFKPEAMGQHLVPATGTLYKILCFFNRNVKHRN